MLRAHGTKILVLKHLKLRDRNGVLLPDSATEDSAYGLVLSVGEKVTTIRPTEVVLFSPVQLGGYFENLNGSEKLETLDEEAVLAKTTKAFAEEYFGVQFPPLSIELAQSQCEVA